MNVMKLRALALVVQLTACGQADSFQGISDTTVRKKTEIPSSPGNQTTTAVPEALTPDLNDDDRQTLQSCKQKDSALLTGVKFVEVKNVSGSIVNKDGFADSYRGSEKRVLILNVSSSIINKLSLRLSSASTTYCINISAKIINKMDVGVAEGARVIEATQITLSNKIVTHQI